MLLDVTHVRPYLARVAAGLGLGYQCAREFEPRRRRIFGVQTDVLMLTGATLMRLAILLVSSPKFTAMSDKA